MDPTSRSPMAIADAPAGSSQRSNGRDSLFLGAQLSLPGESAKRDVRVRNLSEGGLMVELDRPVADGTAVTLTLRGVGVVAGTVAWCAEGRIGVAFDRKIDPMLARKPLGKGGRMPGFAKPPRG